jgi:hypothetical protein
MPLLRNAEIGRTQKSSLKGVTASGLPIDLFDFAPDKLQTLVLRVKCNAGNILQQKTPRLEVAKNA